METTYRSIVPLNQEHGLRDMRTIGDTQHQKEVVIESLSQEEIDNMIKKENNEKVADGLRKYAAGRTTYSYNSADDRHFICVEETSSKTK